MLSRFNTFYVSREELRAMAELNVPLDFQVRHIAAKWIAQMTEEGYIVNNVAVELRDDSESPDHLWVHAEAHIIKKPEPKPVTFNDIPARHFTFEGSDWIINKTGLGVTDSDNYHVADLNPEQCVALAKDIMRRVVE